MEKIKFSKSEKINNALYKMGIFSYKDVINTLPRKYIDYSLTKETNLNDKDKVVIEGKIVGTPLTSRFKNISVTKFTFVSLAKNIFYVEAWNRPYLAKTLNGEEVYTLNASYDLKKNKLNLINITKGKIDKDETLKPQYALPNDIEQYQFHRLVLKAFKEVDSSKFINDVPAYFIKKYRLLNKYDALYKLHFPKSYDDLYQGMRVFKYYESLFFTLKNHLIRYENKLLVKETKNHIDIKELKDFLVTLPYELTSDQKKVTNEIIKDMNDKSLMYRLLQGDVGTGKTLVALIALYANYIRGDQGALMAPTDALARQHYKVAVDLFKNTNIKIALLLGSTSTKDRSVIRAALMNHEIDLVIGTHVLFSKDINYDSLGLAIIDEQHKFGVNQRQTLASKGEHADLLLMSATPIPRTLALTLYGDLDVSTVEEYPFKDRHIETKILKDDSKELKKLISNSLESDKRIFVVAPLIDDENQKEAISAEFLYAKYALKYPGKVSLLHGRLDYDDKNFALQDFIKGITPILVSTTVIEVGIDVKKADLMIIYDPTHFGLASLHQLRGRIGRDGSLANCVLVYDGNDEDELDKLNVLVNSNNGFHIAEEDLRRRGPGELTGVKQSGIANFTFVNLVNDFKIFVTARDDSKFIIENKNEIGFRNILLKASKDIKGRD